MKNEIKEMLQEIKETVDDYLKIYKLEDDMMYDTINYKASQWYALLDYITNLQDYKSRNEKAIEYIKVGKTFDNEDVKKVVNKIQNDLLNILQEVGKDEKEKE